MSASVLVLRYRPVSIEETAHAPDTPGTDEEKYATSSSSSGNTSLADVDASPSSEILEAALVGRLRPQYRWLSVWNFHFICNHFHFTSKIFSPSLENVNRVLLVPELFSCFLF